MRIRKSFLTIILALCLGVFQVSAQTTSTTSLSPMGKIKYIDKLLEGYEIRKQGKELSEAQEAKNKKIKREIVYEHFDMNELCRLAMDKHWKNRTPAQRKEFVDVFTKLIVKNAVFASEKYTGEQVIEYLKESYINKQKTRSKVTTTVYVEDEDVEVMVTYLLIKAPDGWRIYDIIMDDVSLMENYRSQFDRIITNSSYQNLLAKMRKKLETGGEEL